MVDLFKVYNIFWIKNYQSIFVNPKNEFSIIQIIISVAEMNKMSAREIQADLLLPV